MTNAMDHYAIIIVAVIMIFGDISGRRKNHVLYRVSGHGG